ncbi:A disintegrin and metalloproteinase with thrombospondin motifs 17, partial [Lates japonicus]
MGMSHRWRSHPPAPVTPAIWWMKGETATCLVLLQPRRSGELPEIQSQCLSAELGGRYRSAASQAPGMHYSVDEQCQILFGTNATFCGQPWRQKPCVVLAVGQDVVPALMADRVMGQGALWII